VSDGRHRPSIAMWTAWTLAFLGGLAVLGAVALALGDPCLGDAQGLPQADCADSTRPTRVVWLVGAGTTLAVTGGLTATWLSLRRP
jgi:protein-S-isoprenylcysteine O-methyltransferase Ste14